MRKRKLQCHATSISLTMNIAYIYLNRSRAKTYTVKWIPEIIKCLTSNITQTDILNINTS